VAEDESLRLYKFLRYYKTLNGFLAGGFVDCLKGRLKFFRKFILTALVLQKTYCGFAATNVIVKRTAISLKVHQNI
jgi:hypothetical protein